MSEGDRRKEIGEKEKTENKDNLCYKVLRGKIILYE